MQPVMSYQWQQVCNCPTGNVINIQSGKWVGFMSGLGAGLDSFYEYLLKVIILFSRCSYRLCCVFTAVLLLHLVGYITALRWLFIHLCSSVCLLAG